MEDKSQGASENKLGCSQDDCVPLGFISKEESLKRVANSPLNPFLAQNPNALLALYPEDDENAVTTTSIQGNNC